MMEQYKGIKDQYQDCILFFRLGDFYEMFFDDAKLVSRLLELTLTGKNCGLEERAPMCGVPFHAADSYIEKLVKMGYKVAICEQLEDPATTKGMERGVSEGYKERLFEGRYPVTFILVTTDPAVVDVNIHPNKREIRFHDKDKI